ncbi:MAG: response regulator transcription factor [Actinomycetota bacterium]|nr:response regulator transcription factor [Actinomycetota bacterium]
MTSVLIIDDDPSLTKALRIGLQARGYLLHTAPNGATGLQSAATEAPDLVVLDLGLPDMDGIEVCRRIREWSTVPIIVLSAAGDERRKVMALDQGADDYVTKPFSMAELEARLRVALRHRASVEQGNQEPVIEVGGILADVAARQVSVDGEVVQLTAREFELLVFLARNADKICTHQVILREVWGLGYGSETNYLRVYINRLRRKLGAEEWRLRTNPGVGYQLSSAQRPEGTQE